MHGVVMSPMAAAEPWWQSMSGAATIATNRTRTRHGFGSCRPNGTAPGCGPSGPRCAIRCCMSRPTSRRRSSRCSGNSRWCRRHSAPWRKHCPTMFAISRSCGGRTTWRFATAAFPAWPPSWRPKPKIAFLPRSRRRTSCPMSRGWTRPSGHASGIHGATCVGAALTRRDRQRTAGMPSRLRSGRPSGSTYPTCCATCSTTPPLRAFSGSNARFCGTCSRSRVRSPSAWSS